MSYFWRIFENSLGIFQNSHGISEYFHGFPEDSFGFLIRNHRLFWDNHGFPAGFHLLYGSFQRLLPHNHLPASGTARRPVGPRWIRRHNRQYPYKARSSPAATCPKLVRQKGLNTARSGIKGAPGRFGDGISKSGWKALRFVGSQPTTAINPAQIKMARTTNTFMANSLSYGCFEHK